MNSEAWKQRNIAWWRNNYSHEQDVQIPAYIHFVYRWKIDFKDKIAMEVAPGPLGGILQFQNAKRNIFLDVIMTDLWNLGYHPPMEAELVDASFHEIPFGDKEIDVLVGYNSLDHSPFWREAIRECVRVSKEVYLNFDCRDKINEWDKDHYLVDFDEAKKIAESLGCEVAEYSGKDNKFRRAIEIGLRPGR